MPIEATLEEGGVRPGDSPSIHQPPRVSSSIAEANPITRLCPRYGLDIQPGVKQGRKEGRWYDWWRSALAWTALVGSRL